ncbi:MAG: LCP family protein [Propionibacteriaceae bacterium]|nr:LCP family protein [Propionibacteriaceae bacterium]
MSLDNLEHALNESASEQPKPRRKKRRGLIVLAVFGVLVAIILGVVGYYINSLNKALDSIKREETFVPRDYENRPTVAPVPNKAMNVLLMGSDSRGAGDHGRSDVIMWVHVPGDRKDVYITSFTRDMWVDIPGHGKGKINAAYAYGGVQLQVQTLETLIGARIDHVALIDFEGFIRLTELLGGVTVNNPYASKEKGKGGAVYTWPKGEVTVAGEEALAFVRQRYELPTGAWGRAERQREVISAIIWRMTRPDVLANPIKFDETVSAVSKTITVDANVTNQLVYDTALALRLDGRQSIHLLQAPVKGGGKVGDQYVDVPKTEQLLELGTALREDTMASYLAKYPR